MRIGIVAPPWVAVPPTHYGGIEAVIDLLARGFAAAGHEVLLCATGDSTCPVERCHVIERAEGDRMGAASVELRHVIASYGSLIDWDADIVHDHTLVGPVFAERFNGRLSVVTTNHGPFDEELCALYTAISDRVPLIAISRDQASRANGCAVAAVIHHGLDLSMFPMTSGRGDRRGEYFLFLGRMVGDKGVREAILAAKQAGVRLVIAAKMRERRERAFYAEVVRPLLDDDVVYIGEVGYERKVELLRGATALINPIRWPEPFGLVMIEALACGTPVLAFDAGSAAEVVDHGVTGFLCRDVDDLAARIPMARDLEAGRCRAAAERRFNAARMVTDHLELFERTRGLRRAAG